MSGPEDMDPMDNRDDKVLAAEFSLGLLEGEELLAARGRLATDAEFAARKQWWDDWFVPLTDAVGGAEPGPEVWDTIAARIAQRGAGAAPVSMTGGPAAETGTVIELRSRLRRWQWTAGITSAAAAIALAFLVIPDGPAPTDDLPPGIAGQASAAPLMATVPIGDTGLRLDVTYLPESERMLVTAIGLTADGVHDHELWLVPAQGDLQSLGVVTPGQIVSVDLPDDIARNIIDGSQLVLTREPIGGKPEGEAAGPVVAEGAFSQV
ncbi:anti-sigma factor domain-containing protein [Erythrobacter sp. JK5]|uniref:anti-sigma factor n=1 Tax=Erythrobacter sp. JK5 TaxID=2829500 RepID=UPI001BA8994F|nr:anti-sigma factor [Erythrobacter sp. JK5]QUL36658.1 anti-sigma factor [Erythrobacter sp. JK5]